MASREAFKFPGLIPLSDEEEFVIFPLSASSSSCATSFVVLGFASFPADISEI